MNPLEIKELLILICIELPKYRDLINISAISKYYNKIMKINTWSHLNIRIKTDKDLILMKNNYNFNKIDLSYTSVTDESVSLLTNLYILNLQRTKVTDASVSLLTNLHTLNLSYTNVTDTSISLLTNLHTLKLSYTTITDASVSFLTKLHTLNLSWTKVTDSGVLQLTKLHKLNLWETSVTEERKNLLRSKRVNINGKEKIELINYLYATYK